MRWRPTSIADWPGLRSVLHSQSVRPREAESIKHARSTASASRAWRKRRVPRVSSLAHSPEGSNAWWNSIGGSGEIQANTNHEPLTSSARSRECRSQALVRAQPKREGNPNLRPDNVSCLTLHPSTSSRWMVCGRRASRRQRGSRLGFFDEAYRLARAGFVHNRASGCSGCRGDKTDCVSDGEACEM
jgi:hypothetical protein